jgi:hypothetical protein
VKTIRLGLRLEEPTVFPSGTGRRNSSDCFDHVPCGVLRGALAARWLSSRPADEDFHRIFLGDTRFGPGAPTTADGVITSPVPRSRLCCKVDGDHPWIDTVASIATFDVRAYEQDRASTRERACAKCRSAVKHRAGWEWVDDGDIAHRLRPSFEDVTRTAMLDGRNRDGSLFSDSALPKGCQFTAEITGGSAADVVEALGLAEGTRLRMGRSRTTNGTVSITGIEVLDATTSATVWDQLDNQWTPRDGDEEVALGSPGLVVVLTSPAIVLDAFQRPTTTIGCPTGMTLVDSFVDTEYVHGWNAAQGLPKPPDVAVSAGSTFVFVREDGASDLPLADSVDDLAIWMRDGIGLRRSEGFGAVTVQPANLFARARGGVTVA